MEGADVPEIKMLLAATYMEFSTTIVDCPEGIAYDEYVHFQALIISF
jgi:hypothetical protein